MNQLNTPSVGIKPLAVSVSVANADPFYTDSFFSQKAKFTAEYAKFLEQSAPRPYLGEAIEYPKLRQEGFYALIDPSIIVARGKSESAQEDKARRLNKSSAKYQRLGLVGLAYMATSKLSDVIYKAIPLNSRADITSEEFLQRFGFEELSSVFKQQAMRFSKSIAVSKNGTNWVVDLPVAEEPFGDLVGVHVKKGLLFQDALDAKQLAAAALKQFGLRLGSVGVSSSLIKASGFQQELSSIPDAGSKTVLNRLYKNGYLTGFKYEISHDTYESSVVNKFISSLLNNGVSDLTDYITSGKVVSVSDIPEANYVEVDPSSGTTIVNDSVYTVLENLNQRTVVAYARFVVPEDEMAYFVQTPAQNIRPSYVSFFFNNYYIKGATRFPSKVKTRGTKARDEDSKLVKVRNKSRDAFGAARFISPLSRIQSASQGFQQRPRTNEIHICINQENTPYFVPPINNISYYENLMDTSLTGDDGFYRVWHKGLQQDSAGRVKPRTLLDSRGFNPNKLIYTDWVNNKLIYTNSEGNLDSLDLEMAYKLRPYSIFSILSLKPQPHENGNVSYQACICLILEKWLKKNGKTINDYIKPYENDIREEILKMVNNKNSYSDFVRIMRGSYNFYSVTAYFNYLLAFFAKVDGAALENADIEYRDFTENSRIASLRPLGRALKEAAADALSNPQVFMQMQGVDIQMASITTARFLIIAHYAPDYENQFKMAKEESLKYQTTEKSYVPGTFQPAYHFIKDKAMLPHQVKAAYNLKDTPEFAVLAVDAGGGKTMLIITNIIQEIAKGTVKRPLVCCPSYLVKDYVSECMYFTEGKVNPIVIDNSTLRNLGHDKIRTLVESAPPNTLYITAYNTLTVGQEVVNYAGSEFILGEHINFLRSLNFDGIWFDESHFLKARNSRRSIAARYLSSEIPLKRLATGTFMPNRPFDLVKQFSFFYPGYFGSIDQFRETFMHGRNMKAGAASEVGFMLHANCQFIHIRRIEWIANLPPKRETLWPVELTDKQKYAYKAIFDEVIRKVAEDKTLLKALSKSGASQNDEDEDDTELDGNDDENEIDNGDDIEADDPEMFEKLDKHFAAIESYLANPRSNAWSKEFQLSESELVSPKGLKIAEIIQSHINEGIPGKILVATNWAASRDGIYEAFPDWLKKKTLVYHASKKMSLIDEFRNNPEIICMVGIGKSLETGHNFQFCSRLIRSENVWDPGTFEQFLARAFRPSIKEKDIRKPENGGKGVFIDTIVADDTIDVLKAAKLISKSIILAKIYNHDNPLYQQLPEIPEVAASFDNLRNFSSWEALESYKDARQMLISIEREEARRWRAEHPDEQEPTPIKDLGILEGSKIIKNIPYTPGMQIFNADELNLKPLNNYIARETEKNPEFDPVGIPVHTMYGDGVIHRLNESSVAVYLNSIGKVTRGLNRESVFAITKKTMDGMEIKDKIVNYISKTSGITKVVDVKFEAPISDRGNKGIEREALRQQKIAEREQKRQQKKALKEQKQKIRELKVKIKEEPTPNTDFELNETLDGFIEVINSSLALVVNSSDPDVSASNLKPYGFIPTKPYLYAEIKTKAGFDGLLEVLDQYTYDAEGNAKLKPESKIKFRTKDKYMNVLNDLFNEFTFNNTSRKLVVEQKTQTALVDFLRQNFRVITDKKEVRPYPLICDGKLYICFDLKSHAINYKALQRQVIPGVKWGIKEGDLRAFFNSKADLSSTIKDMKADGFVFANEDEMRQQFRMIAFRGKRGE